MKSLYLQDKKIETFIFDMDGTIFSYDDTNTSIDSEGKVLEHIVRQFPRLKIEKIHDLFQKSMHIDRKIWFWNFLKLLELPDNINLEEIATDLETLYWMTFGKLNIPYFDALYFIEQIQPYTKIKMITDGYKPNQKKKIFASGLHKYFDAESIVYSDDVGEEKPSPRIFEYAFSKFKTNSKEAVYIGDKVKKDILGANNVGMTSILLRRGKNAQEVITDEKAQPVITVRNFYELLNLFTFRN